MTQEEQLRRFGNKAVERFTVALKELVNITDLSEEIKIRWTPIEKLTLELSSNSIKYFKITYTIAYGGAPYCCGHVTQEII